MDDNLKKEKDTTTITVERKTHRILKELAAQHEMPLADFCGEAAAYFKKTGIDPGSTLPESATQAVQKLEKRMIGFIRTQEQEILRPMASEILVGMKNYFAGTSNGAKTGGADEGLVETLSLGLGKIEKMCTRQANEILELKGMLKNTQALMVEFSKELDAILKKLK